MWSVCTFLLPKIFICFHMIGFQGSIIYLFSAAYALAMSSAALASVVGAATGGNSELALQFVPILFAPQMIFCGYFITPSLIPAWIRWFQYIFPATYAVRLAVVNEFNQCSVDPVELANCNALIQSVDVDPDNTWWYWLILASQFLVFRILALVILRANARRFY